MLLVQQMIFMGKRKKIKANQVSTVVGHGTQIQGDLLFTGGLHIDGRVKGNVKAEEGGESVLWLSELGVIEGEVHVPMVVLNGVVEGNVVASERIELAPKSKVSGDVTYNLIEMAVGAEVNGRLVHRVASSAVKTSDAVENKDFASTRKAKRLRETVAVES